MLATERLLLRRWQPSDRRPFSRLTADSRVMEFMPGPLSRRESDRLVDQIEDHFREHGFGLCAAELRQDHSFMLLSDSGGGAELRVSILGVELPKGQPNIPVKFNAVGGDYFPTMGTRLFEGRDFSTADSPSGAGVVIISQGMARRFWPGKDAVGRHIRVEGKDCQVVGVVEDAKINRVHEAPEPYLYFPFEQLPGDWGTPIVEAAGDPRALVASIRSEIGRADQKVPIGVWTLHYLMQQAFWGDQMAAGFAGTLGTLGMFLAVVGLYGV